MNCWEEEEEEEEDEEEEEEEAWWVLCDQPPCLRLTTHHHSLQNQGAAARCMKRFGLLQISTLLKNVTHAKHQERPSDCSLVLSDSRSSFHLCLVWT